MYSYGYLKLKILLIFFLTILTLQPSFAVKDWRRTQLDAIENKFNICIETSKSTKKTDYGSTDILFRVRKHKSMAENLSLLDYLMKQKGVKK